MRQRGNARGVARSVLWTSVAAGMVALGTSAWAADDKNSLAKFATLNADGSETYNMAWVGHNDSQGRVIYQTSVSQIPVSSNNINAGSGRVIAAAGHFSAQMLNTQTGVVETNGVSLIDVTNPSAPVYMSHIAAKTSAATPTTSGGSRNIKFCNGNDLPNATKNRLYLEHENGSQSHEIHDVTNPALPFLVSTPATGLSTTHRNFWDCATGLLYTVSGAAATAGKPDGWKQSNPNQHLKIYDASNPAAPKYVMDFGLPGQNPVTSVTSIPAGVHGPIAVSTLNGVAYNRLYNPYGVGDNGIVQIVDTTKMLPAPYGTGKYVDPSKPTDAELLQGQVGRVDMSDYEGGHTSYPVYGVYIEAFANRPNNVRDLLFVTSEETANRCTQSAHLIYILDMTDEAHPWPISTLTVDDFSGRPNYCSRGARFGVHSTHENMTNPRFYGKVITHAWFSGGMRVTDYRNPYRPVEIGYLITPVTANTQPSASTINGVRYSQLSVMCDNTEIDDQDLIYCGDRVGGGLDIGMLTGEGAAVLTAQ